MNREAKVLALFEQALSLEASGRQRFLDDACGTDERLRREILELLDADEAATDSHFLEQPISGLPPVATESADARIGETIDRYDILAVLGEGGFGTVYRARQRRPVERDVALKVVRAPLAAPDFVRRFEAERRVLASLQHPGIAQLLDAGADRDGTTYMVMELVPGTPITEYCGQNDLALPERLALFIQVCDALGHAHQKGVIHRDLKPSNVLVVERDGKAQAKIIDFGIALVLGDSLDAEPRVTREGLLGSPETMSPEQVAGEQDLDTRTDIYGLGVLLYELLTGCRPFSDERGRLVEVLRQIAEEEPIRPTTRAREANSASGVTAPLPDDLDLITLKALEKNRDRRYSSSAELADDVQRSIENRPVRARAPSRLYVTGRFVRRHRLGVTLGVLLLLTLVGGVVGTSIGLLKASREADNARETVALLRQFLAAPDPEDRGRELRVVELLEAFEPSLEALGDRPELAVELLSTYATTYRSLGLYDEGLEFARDARAIRERLDGAGSPETLAAADLEAALLLELDQPESANGLASEALERATGVLGADHPVTLDLSVTVAETEHALGRFEDAEARYAPTIERQERVLGVAHQSTLRTLHRRALNLLHLGEPEAANALSLEAWERTSAAFGPEHPETLNALSERALVLGESGDYEAAGEIHADLLETRTRILGPEHRKTLISMTNLAWIKARLGDHEASITLNRQALALQERVLGPQHRNAIATRANLAMSLARTGELDEAERLMAQALEERTQSLGPDHPETLVALNDMIVVYARQRKYAEAADMARRLADRNRAIQGDRHPATLSTLNNLGWLLNRLDRPEEALPVIEEALEGRTAVLGSDHPSTLGTRQTRVDVLLALNRPEAARAELEALVADSERALGAEHPQAIARKEKLADMTPKTP